MRSSSARLMARPKLERVPERGAPDSPDDLVGGCGVCDDGGPWFGTSGESLVEAVGQRWLAPGVGVREASVNVGGVGRGCRFVQPLVGRCA